jgi:hypothetical protein
MLTTVSVKYTPAGEHPDIAGKSLLPTNFFLYVREEE